MKVRSLGDSSRRYEALRGKFYTSKAVWTAYMRLYAGFHLPALRGADAP